jgi:hypothetical protein
LIEINRTDTASRDDPAIVVDILLLAHDGSSANEVRKLVDRFLAAGP